MTFYSDYEQGKNGRINNNVSVSKRCGSFNFHSMCGYYFGKDFNELYIYRMFNDNNTAFGQNSHRFRTDHNFYYNANISYDVSRKTVFEWYVDGYSSKRSEDGNIHSGFYSSKVDSTLFSSTDNLYKRSNVRTGLNMSGSLLLVIFQRVMKMKLLCSMRLGKLFRIQCWLMKICV